MSRRHKTIGIIGAGRFGAGAARELRRLGNEVLIVDLDEEALEPLAEQCHTFIGDAESIEFLTEVGFKNVDAAIVAIGDNETASNHATMNCKDMGLFVVAKALHGIHGKILERLGADKVIYPEYESGIRLARFLTRSAILEMVELYDEVFMMELEISGSLANRSLVDLDLPQRFGVQIVLARRDKKNIFPLPVSARLLPGDVVVCLGTAEGLTQLAKLVE